MKNEFLSIEHLKNDYKNKLNEFIISCPSISNSEEIEILINSYSKIELAEICLLMLEVIREKNKEGDKNDL